jgi:hypothetical protein
LDQEIEVFRSDLIDKCDQYLCGKLEALELTMYASDLNMNEVFVWDDPIISDIIFSWDIQTINFPINRKNVELWKHLLETDEDLLADHNLWNVHIDKQKAKSSKYQSKWNPINKKWMISTLVDLESAQLFGKRIAKSKGHTGWYFSVGKHFNSNDTFEHLSARSLLQIRPDLIQYLGLDVGYCFSLDEKKEEVWLDKDLLMDQE